jgi:hypothetical protein
MRAGVRPHPVPENQNIIIDKPSMTGTDTPSMTGIRATSLEDGCCEFMLSIDARIAKRTSFRIVISREFPV